MTDFLMRVLALVILLAIAVLFFYLGMSFIKFDLNVAHWTEGERGTVAFFSVISATAYLFLNGARSEEQW